MSIFEFLERLDADPFDPAIDDLFLRRDIQEKISYEMENGLGNAATITVNPDGTATVKEELIGETKSFSTEDQAYTWAYCRGYRE